MVIIIKVVINMVHTDILIINQVYQMDLIFLIDEINEIIMYHNIIDMDKCK